MNDKESIPELTRGEEQIMQILWRLGEGFVSDIIGECGEPKPKYTTVATFVRILENKGFVAHESCGKSHRYRPLVAKDEYAQERTRHMLTAYFDGSLAHMVSFFSKRENISMREMEEILSLMEQAKKR